MFTFRFLSNTQIQWLEGAVSHPGSTKRLSSFIGDLNSFFFRREKFFKFRASLSGQIVWSPANLRGPVVPRPV